MIRRLGWLIYFLQLFLYCPPAFAAAKLPGDSAKLLPVLKSEIDTYWPTHPKREWVAGIPDQEANWKINATLKTSREWGCGLGQFTVAYDKHGNVRFDALEETKRLDPSLKDWSWEDCANAQYQLRGLVLKLKSNYRNCSVQMANYREALACDAAKYNGGAGTIVTRIRYCRTKQDCHSKYWFGNLEKQCGQSKTRVAGYGESFCEINSKYPGRVEARMPKFKGYLDD